MRLNTVIFSKSDILNEHYVNVELPKAKSEMSLITAFNAPPKPSRRPTEGVVGRQATRPVSTIVTGTVHAERQRKLSSPFVKEAPAKPPMIRKPVIDSNKPAPRAKPTTYAVLFKLY